MNWVLDVGAAFAVVRKTQQSKVIKDALVNASIIYAPTLFFAEIFNTAWKYHQFGNYKSQDCLALGEMGSALVDEYLRIELFSKKAFEMALKYQISVYDAYYLSAAVMYDVGLLTLDQKLANVAEDIGITGVDFGN